MIFLLEASHSHEQLKGMKILESRVTVFDHVLHVRIGFNDGSAKLSDIVPLAYAFSDQINEAVKQNLAGEGRQVPCQKGCSFCCDYLVSLSLPEVYYMQQQVRAGQHGNQHTLLRSCFRSARKILNLERLQKYKITEHADISQISQWYRELEITCPFLLNKSCTIYDKRPLACREHLVISPPGLCQKESIGTVERVSMPVSLLEVLGQLAADLEQTAVDAILLPLVPVSIDQYQERAERIWPAEEMVRHFLEILELKALKSDKQMIEVN